MRLLGAWYAPEGQKAVSPGQRPGYKHVCVNHALEGQKLCVFSAFAPLGRYLLLRHKPRALPWAGSYLALQAEFTGQQ